MHIHLFLWGPKGFLTLCLSTYYSVLLNNTYLCVSGFKTRSKQWRVCFNLPSYSQLMWQTYFLFSCLLASLPAHPTTMRFAYPYSFSMIKKTFYALTLKFLQFWEWSVFFTVLVSGVIFLFKYRLINLLSHHEMSNNLSPTEGIIIDTFLEFSHLSWQPYLQPVSIPMEASSYCPEIWVVTSIKSSF